MWPTPFTTLSLPFGMPIGLCWSKLGQELKFVRFEHFIGSRFVMRFARVCKAVREWETTIRWHIKQFGLLYKFAKRTFAPLLPLLDTLLSNFSPSTLVP